MASCCSLFPIKLIIQEKNQKNEQQEYFAFPIILKQKGGKERK